MTAIAERIGKSTSTVSREITNRSQAGLPALSSTQRGSRGSRSTQPSKLVTNLPLRQAVEDGLAQQWSSEEISIV